MNKLIVQFARWATGLPSYADSDAVLREAGLRPIQYDMLQARLNYWLLLKSRDPTHATNLALADISHRASTSSLYKWYKHIRDVFVKLNCDSLLASPAASINKCVIKRVVHECWLHEGSGSAADIESVDKYTYHLRNIRNNLSVLDTVMCTRMNVMASPACCISMHTQISFMYAFNTTNWIHMDTTNIKRHEQEALSLFRIGVAPAFMLNTHKITSSHRNRFHRICEYCEFMYNTRYVNDVFHVLFVCPLVGVERIRMFQCLDSTCGATEWVPFASVFDLGITLLCPQSINVACVVGRFLSEYLAAKDVLYCETPFCTPPKHLGSTKWLGKRSEKLNELRVRINSEVGMRNSSLNVIPMPACVFTNMWVIWHSYESLPDLFKPIRGWPLAT